MLEKVAYIKGLLQGIKLPDDDPYKEMFTNILDLLDDMAASITDAEDHITDLDEYIREVDEDLEAVEDFLDEECEEDDFYTIICPECGEEFSVDEEIAESGEVICPNCGEELEFDLNDLTECDGDCGSCEFDASGKEEKE